MKKIVVLFSLLALVLSLNLSAQTIKKGDLTWQTKFEEAQKIAKKEKKAIFALFTGSDWCPWCVKLDDEILKTKEFVDYANKNLVLVYVDFPRKTKLPEADQEYNKTWMKKYPEVKGYPTVVLMDSEFKAKGYTGYTKDGVGAFLSEVKAALLK